VAWNFTFGKKKPLTSRAAANDAVRDRLAEEGDDGRAVRHVLHYAYPTEKADMAARSGMIAELAGQGFDVRDAAVDNGVVLEHYRSVAGSDFDRISSDLETWFANRNWDYDGWECAIVKGKLN
jgi:hypothetical protein